MRCSLHGGRGDGSDLRQVGLSFLTCQTEITAVPASRGGLGFQELIHPAPWNRHGPNRYKICGVHGKMKTRGLVQK